ncbi:hypothetical protein, partial [Chryseobacterium sp. SIMBA_029]|uniref:hypothetical protein n=1 Tax=Chryseobacterium sp. SIMBA_029 TaxID=3085772 RepID=UPI00397D6C81
RLGALLSKLKCGGDDLTVSRVLIQFGSEPRIVESIPELIRFLPPAPVLVFTMSFPKSTDV